MRSNFQGISVVRALLQSVTEHKNHQRAVQGSSMQPRSGFTTTVQPTSTVTQPGTTISSITQPVPAGAAPVLPASTAPVQSAPTPGQLACAACVQPASTIPVQPATAPALPAGTIFVQTAASPVQFRRKYSCTLVQPAAASVQAVSTRTQQRYLGIQLLSLLRPTFVVNSGLPEFTIL